MTQLYEYEPVDESFLTEGDGAHWNVRAEIPCDADTLFRIFEDAQAWCDWLGCEDLVWTSPEPRGVGTTRTITLLGDSFDEHFFAWKPGRRMAFRIARGTNKRMEAFAESFDITPLAAERCTLHYYGTVRLAAPRITWPAVGLTMTVNGKLAFRRLAKYAFEHRVRYSPAMGS